MKNLLIFGAFFLLFTSMNAQSTSLRVTNYSDYRVYVRAVAFDQNCNTSITTAWDTLDGYSCGSYVTNILPVASSSWTWEIVEILNDLPGSTCQFMAPNSDSQTLISNPFNSCPDAYSSSQSVQVNCNIICVSPFNNPSMLSVFSTYQNVDIY